MEAKLMKRKVTKEQAYLSELALASFQHEEKGIVIFLIFHLLFVFSF